VRNTRLSRYHHRDHKPGLQPAEELVSPGRGYLIRKCDDPRDRQSLQIVSTAGSAVPGQVTGAACAPVRMSRSVSFYGNHYGLKFPLYGTR